MKKVGNKKTTQVEAREEPPVVQEDSAMEETVSVISEDDMLEELRKLPKSVVKQLFKKANKKPSEGNSKKEVAAETSPKTTEKKRKKLESPPIKNFDFTPRSEDEVERYNGQIELMRRICGTLSEQRPQLIGTQLFLLDCFNGQPCQYMCFSIPHYEVGIPNRSHPSAPIPVSSDKFYGAFTGLSTLIAFLKHNIGCTKDDILVKNVAQYYGVNSRIDAIFDKNNELERVVDWRCLGGEKNPIITSQDQKSEKGVKNTWYYYSPSRDDQVLIDKKIPPTKFINRLNMEALIDGYEFPKKFGSGIELGYYSLVDYIEAKESLKKEKDGLNSSKKIIQDFVKTKNDPNYIEKIYTMVIGEKDNNNNTKKRSRGSTESTPTKEQGMTLELLLSKISDRISTNSSVDYFNNDFSPPESETNTSEDDEPVKKQKVETIEDVIIDEGNNASFEHINFSDEEEEVPKKKPSPKPIKKRSNNSSPAQVKKTTPVRKF